MRHPLSIETEREQRATRATAIIQDYAAEMPVEDISKKYDIGKATVIKYARAAGLTRNRVLKTLEPAIIAAYQSGEKVESIYARFGIERSVLYRALKRAGITAERRPKRVDP